jgi:hypothetical protein
MAVPSNRLKRQLVLTPRDEAVLRSIWDLRCVTREQLQRLHFVGLNPSVAIHRLTRLRAESYLVARRLPTRQVAGAVPYLYSLGSRAVPLISEWSGVDSAEVTRRARQDSRLSWLFHEHRQAINDVRIALSIACRSDAGDLRWLSEEEMASEHEDVELGGRRVPVRPDGFGVLELNEGKLRSAFFLEVQRESRPVVFLSKAKVYMAYWASGGYTSHFGLRSLRVLTVTVKRGQTERLKSAIEQSGGATLFWFANLEDVLREPFGAVWLVGGVEGRRCLLEEA